MISLNFNCYYEFCGKEFNTKFNLKRHINSVHLKIKDFQCPICGKSLVSKIAYKEHSYTHENIKPLKCPYLGCTETFSRSSVLCEHKKTHGKDEPVILTKRNQPEKRILFDFPKIRKDRALKQAGKKVPLHHLLLD